MHTQQTTKILLVHKLYKIVTKHSHTLLPAEVPDGQTGGTGRQSLQEPDNFACRGGFLMNDVIYLLSITGTLCRTARPKN